MVMKKNIKTHTIAVAVFLFVFNGIKGQIEITSMVLNQYNVTSASLLQQVSIFNAGVAGPANIVGILKDQNGDLIVSTSLNNAVLANGINLLSSVMELSEPIGSNFGTTPLAEYVSTYHILTTGNYEYCIEVTPLTGNETPVSNCELLAIVDDAVLFLVDPLHLDTIYTTTPTLVWGHNQPFSILGVDVYFRLILVELLTNQDAATGLAENTPIFTANNLMNHVLPYPQNSSALLPGHRYGWIVEKVFQGNVAATTDPWEFVVNELSVESNINFAVARAKNDNAFHPLIDGKLYIYFKERYNNKNNIELYIRNPEGELIEDSLFVEPFHPEIMQEGIQTDYGFNECYIDFRGHGLSNGYYNVEIIIGKEEKYYVNTYVEQ
jgi:hypothetical protein